MKKVRLLAASAALAAALMLSGCGGGGGGGGGTGDVPAAPSVIATATCPNGSPVPATGTKDCPIVGLATGFILPAVDPRTSTVDPRASNGEIAIPPAIFSGKIDPSSTVVTLWLGASNTGTAVAGKESIAADGTITLAPVQWMAYGQAYILVIDAKDSVGRLVHLEIPFTTITMVCANSAIWSNPANFSKVYKDCVADIGVQTQINPLYNTLQDDTCIMTIGTPLTAACKAYMANGTMMLANTSIVVNGHAVLWDVYLGTDGVSNAVLLDINDPTNPIPISTFVSPASIVFIWDIGNLDGLFIHTGDGKGSQLTVDPNQKVVPTCKVNC